jgi:hypothetical protein
MAIILTPAIQLAHNVIEKYLGHETAQRMKLAAMGKENELDLQKD